MNGLVIVLIGIVALGAGYLFYGRWLAKKWGIDPNAKTPAYTHEDGEDYVPSSKFTVFSHQFSSIAGAGPVTGPILASVFGWVPVLLMANHWWTCSSELYRTSVLYMHPLKMKENPWV